MTPRERNVLISAHFQVQFNDYAIAFNKETLARNQLVHAYRQLGPLVLLDRTWDLARRKTEDFWTLAKHAANAAATPDPHVGWIAARGHRHVVDAVVDIVRVLGGNDAVNVVCELLDHPKVKCLYLGAW
jgi:hypothetical protein